MLNKKMQLIKFISYNQNDRQDTMQRRGIIASYCFLQITLFYSTICKSFLFHQTRCTKTIHHSKNLHGYWPLNLEPRIGLFAHATAEDEVRPPLSIVKRMVASISAGILLASNGAASHAVADDNYLKETSEPSIVVGELQSPSIFPFVKPSLGQSKLLTTTVRSLAESTESRSAGSNAFKKIFQFNENIIPNIAALYNSLPNWVTSYSGQIFAAGCSVIILADRLAVGSDLTVLCEEQAKNITILSAQVQSLSKSAADLDTPANTTSIGVAESAQTGELQSRLQQLSTSFDERGAEIQRLRNAMEELKRDILKQVPTPLTASSLLLRDLSYKNQQLETQVNRFKADAERYQLSVKQLMDATKTFLVKKNLLAQGLVNMLLPSTAAEVLLQAADKAMDPKTSMELNELQTKLQSAATEIAGAEVERKLLTQQLQQSKDQLNQQSSSWQQREDALTQKQKALEQELLLQTETQAADKDFIAKLQEKIQSSDNALQELTKVIDELAKFVKLQTAVLQALEAETAAIKQDRDKALEQSVALSKELEQAKLQLAESGNGSPAVVAEDSGDSKLESARAMAKELNAMLKTKEGQLGTRKLCNIIKLIALYNYDMIMMMIIAVNSQLNEMKAENERLQLELSETRKNPRPDNIPVPSPPSIPAAEDAAVEVAKAKAEPKKKSRQIKVAFPYAMACKFLTAYVLSVHTCFSRFPVLKKKKWPSLSQPTRRSNGR